MHLFDTCRDDHEPTPRNCRRDCAALLERTRLRHVAGVAVEQQERRELRGAA